jgi:hypothetical protein
MDVEAKVSDIKTNPISIREQEPIVEGSIGILTKNSVIYWQSESNLQRKIIGSMCPEKFTFESLKTSNRYGE